MLSKLTKKKSKKSDGSDVRTHANIPADDAGNFSLVSGGETILSEQFLGGAAVGEFGDGARFVTSKVSPSADYTGNTGFVYGSVNSRPNSEAVFVYRSKERPLSILADSGRRAYYLTFG